MDPDDLAYKKSVRNMSVVLAVIVITIFAALVASPYLFPTTSTFQTSTTFVSAFGFTLYLRINTTTLAPDGNLQINGWLNSSSGSVSNITAADTWGIGPANLWTAACTSGWPIGVGVIRGHYTQDNSTFGTLYPIPIPAYKCLVGNPAPNSFLLEPHSSKALVTLNGTPQYWVLQSNYTLNTRGFPPGTYTAVLADEWGDVMTTNFIVS
jgi:hypothetical protein